MSTVDQLQNRMQVQNMHDCNFNNSLIVIRGGVEDTKLEAKAKDTKKIRGQGQPFRGQTLSRPRTGMLEAKAKDQGHKAQVLSKKKKVFTKIFQAISKKKKFSQKFFKRSPLKNVFQKIFQALHKILTFQKIVLSSSRGQANFRGLEASRPRTSKCVLEDSTSDSNIAAKMQDRFRLRKCCCKNYFKILAKRCNRNSDELR